MNWLIKKLLILTILLVSGNAFAWGTPKNSFKLLLGASKTKLEAEKDEKTQVTTVYTRHEFDLGLQYERKFDTNRRCGFVITSQQNAYLTIGWDW